mmetsp:Transcript_24400/g.40399  ORF Transcript_24400/g.40399 Transcript_24400/m.40399 type:complete len:230 (+) Transcript_24400:323-1012(+)
MLTSLGECMVNNLLDHLESLLNLALKSTDLNLPHPSAACSIKRRFFPNLHQGGSSLPNLPQRLPALAYHPRRRLFRDNATDTILPLVGGVDNFLDHLKSLFSLAIEPMHLNLPHPSAALRIECVFLRNLHHGAGSFSNLFQMFPAFSYHPRDTLWRYESTPAQTNWAICADTAACGGSCTKRSRMWWQLRNWTSAAAAPTCTVNELHPDRNRLAVGIVVPRVWRRPELE